jgi:hypothetical protein
MYPLGLKSSEPPNRPKSMDSPSASMSQSPGGVWAQGPNPLVYLPGLQQTNLTTSALPLPSPSLIPEQQWRDLDDGITVFNPTPQYRGITNSFSISKAPGWELPTPRQISSQEWQRAMNKAHDRFHQQPCWCSKHDCLACRVRKLGTRRTECPEEANDTNCNIISKAEDTLDIDEDSVEAAANTKADDLSEEAVFVDAFVNNTESSVPVPASTASQRTQSTFEDVYGTCDPHSPSFEGWSIISRRSHHNKPRSASYPMASSTGEYVSISPSLARTLSWDAVSDGSPMSPFVDLSLPDDYP